MIYRVKRGFSKRENCYMYGIYKDGELYKKMVLFGKKNAELVADFLNMMEEYILDQENGMRQIMQILRIDKERKANGKVEYSMQRKRGH